MNLKVATRVDTKYVSTKNLGMKATSRNLWSIPYGTIVTSLIYLMSLLFTLYHTSIGKLFILSPCIGSLITH